MALVQSIDNIINITRIKSPIGIWLLFLPCALSISLNIITPSQLYYFFLFGLGSCVMRSAGCVINDIVDTNIDKAVMRTQNRPLASGKMRKTSAYVLLLALLVLGLIILLQLPLPAIIIGVIALPLVILYPFMKRITYLSQLFLGITFNIGVFVVAATLKGQIQLQDIILYCGCVCWTLAYDTIYAFMDYPDDINIGVKSLAILLLRYNYRMWLIIFYCVFYAAILLALKISNTLVTNVFIVLDTTILTYSILDILRLNVHNANECLRIFKYNQIYGTLLVVGVLINKIDSII